MLRQGGIWPLYQSTGGRWWRAVHKSNFDLCTALSRCICRGARRCHSCSLFALRSCVGQHVTMQTLINASCATWAVYAYECFHTVPRAYNVTRVTFCTRIKKLNTLHGSMSTQSLGLPSQGKQMYTNAESIWQNTVTTSAAAPDQPG